MAIDIATFKANCEEYSKAYKSKEVLKNADGKKTYDDISKVVGLYRTTVSGLLAKAEKLGLANRVRPGVYKKVNGVLSYLVSPKKTGSSKTVTDLIKKVAKASKGNGTVPPINSLPIAAKLLTDLADMERAYRSLYAVENSLRQLIRNVLGQNANWWSTYVPSGIQKEVLETISKSPYHAAKRNDELEYAHLGQLKEIIIYRKNWDVFSPFLNEKDKNSFSATINKAIPSRNAIGHCIPLKKDDLRIVDVRFGDILKMLK